MGVGVVLDKIPDLLFECSKFFLYKNKMTVLVVFGSGSVAACLKDLLKLLLFYGKRLIIPDASAEFNGAQQGVRFQRKSGFVIYFHIIHVIAGN